LVSATVVIDAAGTSSPLGRDEGICWKAYDVEPAIFAVAEAPGFATDGIHVFMSEKLAPGGYGWIFPSSDGRVNAGVVVGSRFRKRARLSDLLEEFLKRNLPGCRVLSRHAGAIACGYERWPIAIPGLLKAGDAASTTNPISRGGIVEALHCGAIAGRFAADMLGASTERELAKHSREYERAWYEKMGKRHLKLAAAKNALAKVPDADYDAAVEALSGIPQAQMTMARIFRAALMRFPRLIWAMRHLM
jgi:digeranylgeranylglycerophospholipid reductase